MLLFSYLMVAVIFLLFYAHCLYARAVFFTHTLIRSLLTTLNSHVQGIWHLFILSGIRWDHTYCEELESLFSWL